MSFFTKKRLFIVLLGFILIVALIGFSLNKRDQLSAPEQFIKDTVGWTQQLIHSPVKYVTNVLTNIKDIKNTYEENKVLREKLAEYKGLIYEVQKLKEDNEELRETIEKTDEMALDFNPIQATVISRSPERWLEQVTINKGKQHGVQNNMAVITAEGMIGKIHTASQFTSTVQLLTGFDQFNRISATVYQKGGKEIFGLIEEYDKETDSLLFTVIEDSEEELKEGDLVVSSGMGGVFPSGLSIGTVRETHPDQYGLTNTALIKPIADTHEINHVIVVDRKLETFDEDAEEPVEDEGE